MVRVTPSYTRRINALALVLVLVLFAYAAGLHSMHNLSNFNQATQCAVASASTHLSGATVKSVAVEQPAELFDIISEARSTDPSITYLGPAKGRAPPPFTA